MSTFHPPELTEDFQTDFEDLMIQYVYDKWSITDPAKGSQMQPDSIAEPDTIGFRSGFPDYFRPYEVCCIQTVTLPIEGEQTTGKGSFWFTTTVQFLLRMKRLDRDALEVNPQLENMEDEIERIVQHYVGYPQDIPGIKDLEFDYPVSVQRVYDATDNYAKSDWRSVVSIKLLYQKVNLL